MSSAHLRSVRVGLEASFGSISSTTGLPSTNGITFRSLECERGSLETFGDATMNERAETRDGPHQVPPEPDTVWSSGVRVQKREGTITLTCPWRTLGTGNATSPAITNYATMPLFQLLNSGMWAVADPAGGGGLTLASNLLDEKTVRVSDATDADVGSLIGFRALGRYDVSSVVGKAATVLTLSPSLATGDLATSSTPRMMKTLYTDANLDNSSLGSSLCLVLDGQGWRSIAHGCRLESFTINRRGHQALLEVTLRAAYVKDDHANASIAEPQRTNAGPAHFLNSYVVVTDDASDPVTAGANLGRNALQIDECSISYNNTLTPQGFSDNVLGMADLEVTDVAVEASLTLSLPTNLFSSDFRSQVQRGVMIGLAGSMTSAGGGDGGPTTGNGAAVYLPGGVLMVDADKRELGSDIVRQVLTYSAGRFQGDDASTKAANSMFKLGMGF